MKETFNHYFNMLLSSMLVLLGFSSCSNNSNKDDIYPLEYGSPSADYIFKGTVTNEDNLPIQNIQVITDLKDFNNASIKKDTIYTDAKGEFQKELKTFPAIKSATVKFTDVDDTLNGSYQNATMTVAPTRTKKRDGWYLGEFTFTANQKLKKK